MLWSKLSNVVEYERKLRVHRLFDPQRPIIIEQRNAIRHAHIGRASFGCGVPYEIRDCALCGSIIPRGKRISHPAYLKPGKISSDILRMISWAWAPVTSVSREISGTFAPRLFSKARIPKKIPLPRTDSGKFGGSSKAVSTRTDSRRYKDDRIIALPPQCPAESQTNP